MLGVLEALSSGAAALSLAQLSRLLGIPKSSLFSLLAEMTHLGLVQRDEEGLYRQHGRSRRLGLQLVAPDSFAMLVRQVLGDIASALGVTATLSRLDAATCALIYIDRWEVPDPVRFVLSYGQPLDLHCRAAGKLLVAHQPRAQWAHWLGTEPYRRMTEHTQVSLQTLAPELERIARHDVAWSRAESFPGVGSCNVGVRGADGEVLAALGIEAPLARLRPAMEARILDRLRGCAQQLSDGLCSRAITRENLTGCV
jgi:DNA-binding IclR family transcriptional regulator